MSDQSTTRVSPCMQTSKVIVMRGLPGVGKSTWVKKNHPDAVVCSADLFFTDPDTGIYRYDPTKIGEAHRFCLMRFLEAVLGRAAVVVVDNTNTTELELAPYCAIAQAAGCALSIVEVRAPLAECLRGNTHNVSLETMARMFANMDKKLPPWWPAVEVVDTAREPLA